MKSHVRLGQDVSKGSQALLAIAPVQVQFGRVKTLERPQRHFQPLHGIERADEAESQRPRAARRARLLRDVSNGGMPCRQKVSFSSGTPQRRENSSTWRLGQMMRSIARETGGDLRTSTVEAGASPTATPTSRRRRREVLCRCARNVPSLGRGGRHAGIGPTAAAGTLQQTRPAAATTAVLQPMARGTVEPVIVQRRHDRHAGGAGLLRQRPATGGRGG